jgi:tRNA modification GTPase
VARVSALRRDGFAELEEAIAAAAGDGDRADESALVVTARHAGALERVREALREAARSTETQETEEIIALHLRDALHALGEITGETATDEILGVVFSRFCVGK